MAAAAYISSQLHFPPHLKLSLKPSIIFNNYLTIYFANHACCAKSKKKPVENWKLADMTEFLAHSYLITRELRLKTQSLNLVLLVRVHVHVLSLSQRGLGKSCRHLCV